MSDFVTKETVLIVDDTPENLRVLGESLRYYYHVRAANSGARALDVVTLLPKPDLILLDVMMPGMDGYECLRLLRENPETQDIPVIFVTALSSVQDEQLGLALGAADYITKPFVPALVQARVHTQLALKKARSQLRDHNNNLEAEVLRRIAESELIQEVSIRALAHLAETRDPETGNHILRTQGYVQLLAIGLKDFAHLAPILTDRYIRLLTRSAPLHDIGKVGIPDAILQKPGPLTAEEWAVMKTHARIGNDAIDMAERDASTSVEFLALAKEIAHWHHEKWDGRGYPDGLAGTEIPLSARIMALADVFDALVSRRVYKAALPYATARDIIASGKGSHFDPDMVAVFLAQFDSFCAIADRYRDPPPDNFVMPLPPADAFADTSDQPT